MQDKRKKAARCQYATLGAALLLFALSGCGPTSEERLERGQQAFAQAEYRAAAIDARTILQNDPDNEEARLLLGKAALELGDFASADKEFRRALQLGVDKSAIATSLGRLMLAQREYQRLLDELPVDLIADPAEARQLQRLRGEAMLGLGRSEDARRLFQVILQEDQDDTAAMLGIVSSYISEERFGQARATLDEIIAIDGSSIPAWLRSGGLSLAQGDPERAQREFSRAAELAQAATWPGAEAEALRGLIEARLALQDVEGAVATITQLENLAPNDIRTHYLKGRMAYIRQDWETAQDHLQTVLSAAPNFRPALMLLGAVQLQRGNLEQADMYLSTVVEASPDDAEARRLLAEARIQRNKASEATELLEPLLATSESDALSLGLAARANFIAGDYVAAVELLKRRLEQNPDNMALKLDLAAAYIAAGRLEDASAILAAGGDGSEADEYRLELLRILSSAQSGDFESAISGGQSLVASQPDDLRLKNLLGVLYLLVGDPANAEPQFRAVAELNPSNRFARLNLGKIKAVRGDYDGARLHLEPLLDENPEDTETLIALGIAAATAGDVAKSIEWLERARRIPDSGARPRVLLAGQYMAQKNPTAAAGIAREALEIDDRSAEAHAVLGAALESADDLEGGLESYRRAIELAPANTSYAMNLARVQLKSGDRGGAADTLSSIEYSEGLSLISSLQLALLTSSAGDRSAAIDIGEDLARRFPDSDLPHLLLGETLMQEGRPAEGAQQFELALDKRMALRTAGRAFMYRKKYDITPVTQPLERLLEKEPDNATGRLILAEYFLQEGRNSAAANAYRTVLVNEPENFTALNNLAWLSFTQGDERAEEYARRAYAQAPENGPVMDTLGWILVNDGAVEEGLEFLRKADAVTDGKSPAIRFHLAAALVKTGQQDAARNILTELLSQSESFAERDDAEALLQRL